MHWVPDPGSPAADDGVDPRVALEELAWQDRDAMLHARDAVLLVDGLSDSRAAAEPILHDLDGRQRFICPAGSPLLAEAILDRAALVRVVHGPVSVVVRGMLRHADVEWVDEQRVDVVEVEPRSVLVMRDDGDEVVASADIPLETWWGQDPVRGFCERIRAVTNAMRTDELRRLVAHEAQLPADAVRSAGIATLDRGGALLEWVDVAGRHDLRLDFPAPAHSAQELSGRLAALLLEQGAAERPQAGFGAP